MTNKLLVEAKRKFFSLTKGGDSAPVQQPKGRKRSKKDAFGQEDDEIIDDSDDKIMCEFAHE